MTKTQAELSGLTFGCELEYEGIGKPYAARLIAEVTGGRVETENDGGVIRTSVRMRDGRVWSIVRDGSLHGTSCESVTPILTIEDLPMLEKVVAALRRGGAIVNERTGLHIHVGMRNAEPVAVLYLGANQWNPVLFLSFSPKNSILRTITKRKTGVISKI